MLLISGSGWYPIGIWNLSKRITLSKQSGHSWNGSLAKRKKQKAKVKVKVRLKFDQSKGKASIALSSLGIAAKRAIAIVNRIT